MKYRHRVNGRNADFRVDFTETAMRLLDLTLPTPFANLAIDEALLNEAEKGEDYANVLRLWESPQPFVVIGRASERAKEANLAACEAVEVPVLRRCSGGTAVVAGPGCLMYAVVLAYDQHPELRHVDNAHQYVMQRMHAALRTLDERVEFRGTCDLCLDGLKFSGNALRVKRSHLLYHGTILYDFPLETISRWLGTPPRQPEYREDREHAAFVTNFPASVESLREAICTEWQVASQLESWPEDGTAALVRDRYSQPKWNSRM